MHEIAKRKGCLVVLSGFSGAGKGTIVRELMARHEYSLSISATTRAPRKGEVDGREYFFLTRDAFESMIESGDFIEWAEFVGNYYGTPKSFVQKKLDEGRDVILEIEVQGAMNVKKQFPEAQLIFVTPPTVEELKRRLVNRGTETMETILKRLGRACEEAEYIEQYDKLLVNDVREESAENLHRMIHDPIFGIPFEVPRNQELIAQIRKDLEEYRLGGTDL